MMHTTFGKTRQRGFSMVELLVGMVIGLMATLVIMQAYENFEGQKRTTTGGADAQTNASIALYSIQREMSLAGYGLPVFSTQNPALKCDPLPTVDHDSDGSTPNAGMYPILLTDGGIGAGASDTVTLRYGNTPFGGVPVLTTVIGTSAAVVNNMGCRVNDIALLVNGSACDMQRVAGLPDPTHITLANASTVSSGMIACMGAWNEIVYAVTNDMLSRNGAANVADIVNIQAQYGISATPTSNTIVQWVDPVGGTWGASATTPSLANRNLIKAVRIAVVARNGLLEKETVSSACSSTTTASPTGVCAWEGTAASPAPTIDLSNTVDWDHYRYRVYDVIVPLRNIVWSMNTLS